MEKKTEELLNQFKIDHEVYVGASDALTYWILHARIPVKPGGDLHNLHAGRRYVSGPGQDGNVLIFPDPERSDAYLVESWGNIDSFHDFVKTGLDHILADKKAVEEGQEETCGTSCA